MGKAKNKREKKSVKSQPQAASPAASQAPTDGGRRRFMLLGLGGLGAAALGTFAGYQAGWFGSSAQPTTSTPSAPINLATGKPLPPAPQTMLTADAANALRACDELTAHYARELNDPSALIHAVIAFGKSFTLSDGSKAVDYLCSKFGAEREVNGKRYVYFPREVEVHENSFLQTFVEAGVSPDQAIMGGGNKYTLRDLGEGAKALFRIDPQNLSKYDPMLLHRHLPWDLMSLSTLAPPNQARWTNAYGEKIELPAAIEVGLKSFESSCAGVEQAIIRNEDESLEFRQEMAKHACFGMHLTYSFFTCYKNGYRENGMAERLKQALDTLTLRLKGDYAAIERESALASQMGQEYIARMAGDSHGSDRPKGPPPSNIIEVMKLRHQIKMLGHALEIINYVQLNKLFPLNAEQKRRVAAGEQLLYENIVKLRGMDLDAYKNWNAKFVNDVVIALGHASRAMKLLTPANPDTVA